MKNAVKELRKPLLESFIISFLIFIFFKLKISTFFYLFVYFSTVALLPDWLKNNDISWGKKLSLAIVVGAISMATIIYIYGIGRTLYRYIIFFSTMIIFSIIIDCIKKIINYVKKSIKN